MIRVLEDFLRLSAALTGDAALDSRFGETVLAGIAEGQRPHVERLLQSWSALPSAEDEAVWIAKALWTDDSLRRICQDIILSWSFGQCFRDGKAFAPAEVDPDALAAFWFTGSFWRLAKAHPPGLPGGYFGHWSYPGEA